MNILDKYKAYITQLKPSKTWQLARFLLHWGTLPLKLSVIGTLGMLMIVRNMLQKKRSIEEMPSTLTRCLQFKSVYLNLPVYENQYLKLYVNRVPENKQPNGRNHNDDHQGARHGTYAFLMSKLGVLSEKIDNATRLHLQKQYGAVRGYKYDMANNLVFNAVDTSGDQLLGLCLAVQSSKDERVWDAYEEAILGIIENDYALRSKDGQSKSDRAMWQPGLETVGAQALTILAALSVGAKLGNKEAKKAYKKLIWKYGYGLLSLFPTAFIPKQRGYFNDHNCMIACYILASNSTGIAKKFWSLIMLYVWSLSYNWCNGYFTGLLNEVQPTWVSKKYLERCKSYMFEEEPNMFAYDGYTDGKVTEGYPVKFNEMNQGEFWPDEEHVIALNGSKSKTKSGLGWAASAIMLDIEESRKAIK